MFAIKGFRYDKYHRIKSFKISPVYWKVSSNDNSNLFISRNYIYVNPVQRKHGTPVLLKSRNNEKQHINSNSARILGNPLFYSEL